MTSTSRLRWDEEGVSLRFADFPYESSEEIADGFIVDASHDHRVAGLEILWPEAERTGCAPEPVLAFGLLCAALAGLSWQYNNCLRNSVRLPEVGIQRRLEWMIETTGLDLKVSREMPFADRSDARRLDLAILDRGGRPLICAAIKRGEFQRDVVQTYTDLLKNVVIPSYPGVVGVGVFIDETGQGHRHPPVEPGVWTDWYNTAVSGGKVWAHNTIIPPSGCDYSWLPKELRDPMFKAEY